MFEIPPVLGSVIAGCVLIGAALPWVVVGLITLSQRLTPPALQGRVYAALDTAISSPQAVSIGLGAASIGATGYRPLLATMAAVIGLTAVYLLVPQEPSHQEPAGESCHP